MSYRVARQLGALVRVHKAEQADAALENSKMVSPDVDSVVVSFAQHLLNNSLACAQNERQVCRSVPNLG